MFCRIRLFVRCQYFSYFFGKGVPGADLTKNGSTVLQEIQNKYQALAEIQETLVEQLWTVRVYQNKLQGLQASASKLLAPHTTPKETQKKKQALQDFVKDRQNQLKATVIPIEQVCRSSSSSFSIVMLDGLSSNTIKYYVYNMLFAI